MFKNNEMKMQIIQFCNLMLAYKCKYTQSYLPNTTTHPQPGRSIGRILSLLDSESSNGTITFAGKEKTKVVQVPMLFTCKVEQKLINIVGIIATFPVATRGVTNNYITKREDN